ncbi:MFS transporter [Antribacter sp. KLBMP9083]|uniref:MFS transporter n=1 Tax=Antribacter soli TaxID=2910976 RepID=A0AA41QDX1_9MICO|nr:MFS transporter [Antribacter soli]MCF4120342.1 MFS transporter [Antribacter soli]
MTIVEQSYAARTGYVRLGILAAALFVVGTNAFVIAGVLPQIAADLGVTSGAVSYSITWYAVVVAVASPVVSVVFARTSRTTLMATGLVLIAVGTFLAVAAPTLVWFMAGRVVAALGGAGLVPTATAAAPALVPPEQRGRALAVVGLGFTMATALGSPLGTALADVGGWRLALAALAAVATVLALVVGLTVRGLPTAVATGLSARLAVLRDGRIALALGATLLLFAAFNVVYLFSSAVTQGATHGDGTALAALLLVYGAGGIVGTWLGGHLTDRIGSRTTAVGALLVEVVVLAALVPADGSLAATAVAFAVWGAVTYVALVAVQHRLADVDPASAGIALSWYSTVMYVGIALAPVVGARALTLGPGAVDMTGAVLAAGALVVFRLGFARRRPRAARRPA